MLSARAIAVAGLLAALCASVLCASAGCMFDAPRYTGPASDHFDGDRFHSVPAASIPSAGDLLLWQVKRAARPYPRQIGELEWPAPPSRVEGGRMRVTFVNHSTVLLQVDGLNILTDPIWSDRASPVSWAGPRRVRPPGVRFEDLPPIDVVVVSHNHYDHMDIPTLARLAREHRPRIFVGLGNKAALDAAGVGGVFELDWWAGAALTETVRLTCVPSQHQSNRGVGDRMATLFCGFVVGGSSGRAYFAGDTGYGPHFREIGDRLGPFRLALLPIGGYEPRWFMQSTHMAPEEAVRAHDDLRARTSVAIHFGTFDLSDEAEVDPEIELLKALAADAGAREVRRFHVLENGEGEDVPPLLR